MPGLAKAIRKHQVELEAMGWIVRLIPDQDHLFSL